jgi:DNA-binding response OmpR family regulator
VQELIARIKALFRRQEAMGQAQTDRAIFRPRSEHRSAGAQCAARQVVDLTPREFELLYFFARHPGEVFSRLALLEQVWGYQHEGYEHTVNTHINRLRIKIEKDAAEPEIILTVWGKGYKFAELNDAPL